jgi:hypothetical protein
MLHRVRGYSLRQSFVQFVLLIIVNFGDHVNVSDIPDGSDSLCAIGAGSQLLAKIADVHVKAAIGRLQIAAEGTLYQVVPRKNLAWGLEEHGQELEFGRS